MLKPGIDILHIAAECSPFAQVGGLGDVLGSLPQALAKEKLSCGVLLPRYGSIDIKKYRLRLIDQNIPVAIDSGVEKIKLYHCRLANNPVHYFFIDHALFNQSAIYLTGKKSQPTNVERFTFFCKAAIEVIRRSLPRPQIIHAHDWHAALIPTFIDQAAGHYSGFHQIRTIFTVHNVAAQGQTSKNLTDYLLLSPTEEPALMEDYYDDQYLNIMKIGILSADMITTVSPSYAREIQTPAFGFGLEQYFQRRKKNLFGIINGLDTELYNPNHDKHIFHTYNAKNVRKNKTINKQRLLAERKLVSAELPLMAFIGRLTEQKGLDILLPAIEILLREKRLSLIVLGTGEEYYQSALGKLARRYPGQASLHIGFDQALAHKIYAAADLLVMPSRFEPCGLGQLIAMRYGCLPIVHAVGGLKDTVIPEQNGWLFKTYSSKTLQRQILTALDLYRRPNHWYTMVSKAMRTDVSWTKSAHDYYHLYQTIL